MFKKGASEFFLTYFLAIAAALMALSVLVYFGFLVDKQSPEQSPDYQGFCEGQGGIYDFENQNNLCYIEIDEKVLFKFEVIELNNTLYLST